MGRLDGKVAVITGGASGMGEATAHLFVREGARVVIGDRQREKGEAVAASIGPDCRFVACDVSNSEDVAGMVQAAVSSWGKLDVMYNNAGIGGGERSIVDCTEEVWQRAIDVDLKGVWLGMKHCIPHMIANGGGSIVSTASIAAICGFPGLAAYGAAKAGVVELTRAAAMEYAAHNIRANAILPGGILTPIIYDNPALQAPQDPEIVRQNLARMAAHPARRRATRHRPRRPLARLRRVLLRHRPVDHRRRWLHRRPPPPPPVARNNGARSVSEGI